MSQKIEYRTAPWKSKVDGYGKYNSYVSSGKNKRDWFTSERNRGAEDSPSGGIERTTEYVV